MSTARLRADRQRKVHWRDESDRRRRVIADAVGAAPIGYLVVVREGRSGERPERQRRQCMTRLLYELDQLDVATVTFESRGSADDRKDRVMLDALRSRRTVSASLRMDHSRARQSRCSGRHICCAGRSSNTVSETLVTSVRFPQGRR